MNFEFLRKFVWVYKDVKLCDLLEIGFPISYFGNDTILEKGDRKNLWKLRIHTGATEYPFSILEYLEKEEEKKSIIGPFNCNPL